MKKGEPHLGIDRRNFLKGALGVSAAGILTLPALAKPSKPVDPNRLALLADTHISEDLDTVVVGIRPAEHLPKVIQQVLAQPQLPTAATIAGDCAYQAGKPGDYKELTKFLKPLREAGVPVYMLFGNHDNRKAFWDAFPKRKEGLAVIPGKQRHVRVLPLPNVNLLLLDTLIRSDHTPGKLGTKQLTWIDKTLGQLKDKPAILMAHHDTRGSKRNSLQDYPQLLKIMKRHPHVKAYFYGHRHQWNQKQDSKIWTVNLPATAHVFHKDEPSGWVDGQFGKDGVKLTLHTINQNPKHPKEGEVVDLAWQR